MQDFALKIVNFLIEDAEINGGNPNTTRVYVYILLHRKITQQQLAELTGYPKSKISKITSLMLDNKIIGKQLIPGTHTNEYYLIDQPNEFNELPASLLLNGFRTMITFFDMLIEKLKRLDPIEHEGRDLLLWRIQDFSKYSQICSAVVDENQYGKGLQNFKLPIINIDQEIFNSSFEKRITSYLLNIEDGEQRIIDFSPEVLAIEDEFHQFLERGVFSREKPSIERILSVFISRAKLTQSKIQELTTFSAGTVSQSLKQLIDSKKIELCENRDKSSTEKYYAMESITLTLFRHHYAVYKEMLIWKSIFEEIKMEMNAFSNDLMLLEGYYPVYTITDKILTIFLPRYQKYLDEHEKLLELLAQ